MTKKVLLLIGAFIVIISIAAILLNTSKQSVTYEVDSGNICEDGQTTLAPRQIERVVIKKSDEAKFIEQAKKEKKCFRKV